MATILDYNKVIYECSCGNWSSLPGLYFCRHCFKLKCDECTAKEIDMFFCPRCFDTSAAPEARAKKNRCFNCNECPICGNVLSARKSNDLCYLTCQSCKWSTKETDIEDRESTMKWPIHSNPVDGELQLVIGHFRSLEIIENMPKDSGRKSDRSAWSSRNLPNKFGLQKMLEKRRKLMEPEAKKAEIHGACQAPSFEEEVANCTLRTLDQIVAQPVTGYQKLAPVRAALEGRTMTRCTQCDRTLVKQGIGAAHDFKISSFAREYVPDFRVSRLPELVPGKTSHILLSITNNSTSVLQISIRAENGEDVVKCTYEQDIELVLPSENSDTSVTAGLPSDPSDVIVFRQKNRIGIRLEVVPSENIEGHDIPLGLFVTYKHDGSFMLPPTSEAISPDPRSTEPLNARFRIKLN